jgi:hypothetical protein
MKIEVFSAGCPLCLRVIEQVERAAHDGDEVLVHNMFEEESEFLADLYDVRSCRPSSSRGGRYP